LKIKEVVISFEGDKGPANPWARWFLAFAQSFAGLGVITWLVVTSIMDAVLSYILGAVFFPVLAFLHYILRACGRRGFWEDADDKMEIKISKKAFHKL